MTSAKAVIQVLDAIKPVSKDTVMYRYVPPVQQSPRGIVSRAALREHVVDARDAGLDLGEGEEGDEISRVRRHAHNDENPPEADDQSSGVGLGHHCSA